MVHRRTPYGQAHLRPGFLLGILLVGLAACGCRTSNQGTAGDTVARELTRWKPHYLLTSSERYSKLHVEIDVVEGTEPPASELETLRTFLEKHCDKPGGITLEVDDRISRRDAKGQFSRSLALKFMNGPPDQDTAFLYLIFYDSKLSPEKKSQPFCMLLPYPGAIFIDHQYVKSRLKQKSGFRKRVLLHEAAHALGLSREESHSEELHCRNDKCLMNAKLTMRLSRFILGGDPIEQSDFCSDCRADLVRYRDASPARNLAFQGRYFVRSEELYHVVSQPGLIFVHVGPLDQLDEEALGELRRKAMAMRNSAHGVTYSTSSMSQEEARRVAAAMKQDSLKTVRDIADKLEAKLANP